MAEPDPTGRSAGRLLAVFCAALLCGCGGQAAPVAVGVATAIATSRAAPPAGPTHDPATLVAVLERRGGAQSPNRVAIVGLDGRARAAAALVPRAVPTPGGLRAVLQPEARVAAGAVYYADGAGAIRRLVVGGGDPRTVATFAIRSDLQALAFAVSPDGLRLVASVVTVEPWHVDVEVATAGGPTTTVRSIDVPATEPGTAPRLLQVSGWDPGGPVALPDGVAAEAQDDGLGLWQGHPARLDAHGLTGAPLGGPGCGASLVGADGTLLCHDPTTATTTVLRPDGSLLHRFVATGSRPRLSPDGGRLVYSLAGRGAVQSLDGGVVALAAGFTPTGWLDSRMLIGTTRGEELAYVVRSTWDSPARSSAWCRDRGRENEGTGQNGRPLLWAGDQNAGFFWKYSSRARMLMMPMSSRLPASRYSAQYSAPEGSELRPRYFGYQPFTSRRWYSWE
jgi:hypothetical protein